MKSPLSKRPALPQSFARHGWACAGIDAGPASGGGMYVVCGVAVSPGVPSRSVRASGVRLSLEFRQRSTRSRGVTEGRRLDSGLFAGPYPALSAANSRPHNSDPGATAREQRPAGRQQGLLLEAQPQLQLERPVHGSGRIFNLYRSLLGCFRRAVVTVGGCLGLGSRR